MNAELNDELKIGKSKLESRNWKVPAVATEFLVSIFNFPVSPTSLGQTSG